MGFWFLNETVDTYVSAHVLVACGELLENKFSWNLCIMKGVHHSILFQILWKYIMRVSIVCSYPLVFFLTYCSS